MKIIQHVMVDGTYCPVTISDENEALQAAHAAGGAIIGVWRMENGENAETSAGDFCRKVNRPQDTSGFDACLYLVTSEEDVTQELLERTARRHLDLPWPIAETERLFIREFAATDSLEPESEYDGDGVFSSREKREAYRHSQYRFAECGLWALEGKESGRLIGKAGITDGELGYHIYPEYRGWGYAEEACLAILTYAAKELELEGVFLRVKKNNLPSLRLAGKLGFSEKEKNGEEITFYKRL